MKQITQNLRWLIALLAMVVSTSAWAIEVTDVLNQSFTGVTGNTYTTFSGKVGNSDAVYAGNCAGGYSSIQLRTSSGILTLRLIELWIYMAKTQLILQHQICLVPANKV